MRRNSDPEIRVYQLTFTLQDKEPVTVLLLSQLSQQQPSKIHKYTYDTNPEMEHFLGAPLSLIKERASEKKKKRHLLDGESNPGHPRDKRISDFCQIIVHLLKHQEFVP